MTRKEAIHRLKTDVYKYADFSENPNEDEFWQAFDMAIKALEQEIQMKNDDVAISRQLRSMSELLKLQPLPPACEKRGLIK